jgi:arylsulfatase A-like enzyme
VRRRVAAGRLSQWGPQIATSESLQLPAVELDYLRALYDAEVRAWDEELAHLLDALASMDLLRSTVVFVTADHCEEFAEHGRLQHGFHLYEELVHVPLVVRGPGIAAGRIETVSAGIDVLPTVAALLDVPVPGDLPGRPLFGPPLPADQPAYTMVQNGWLPDGRAASIYGIRTPGAKLLIAPDADWSAFFDLVADPGEHAPQPTTSAVAAGLVTQLATWRTANPVQRSTVEDPGFRDRLRALGYAD